MQIHLLTVGTRLDNWVNEGVAEYRKRLPRECQLNLVELPLGKRSRGSDPTRAIREEGDRMLGRIPEQAEVIALEERGRAWDSRTLAERLGGWLQSGRDVALLVGGPDGLDPRCRERATSQWSLSPLTLPHGLVRIVVAEQLYRAWSLLNNHPYHRA